MRRDMPICWLGTRQKCARIIIKYPKWPSIKVALSLSVKLESTFCTVPEGWQQALCSTVRRAARSGSAAGSGLCNNDPTIGSTLFYPPDNSRSYRPSQDCHEITREPVLQYALFTAFKVKRMTFRFWGHISRNLVLEMLC